MSTITLSEGLWLERESDGQAQMLESCHACGVQLRDHYDAAGVWKSCAEVA